MKRCCPPRNAAMTATNASRVLRAADRDTPAPLAPDIEVPPPPSPVPAEISGDNRACGLWPRLGKTMRMFASDVAQSKSFSTCQDKVSLCAVTFASVYLCTHQSEPMRFQSRLRKAPADAQDRSSDRNGVVQSQLFEF